MVYLLDFISILGCFFPPWKGMKKILPIYKPLKNVLKKKDQPTELVNWMTVE